MTRLRLWLLAMDAVYLCGGYGCRLYLWCLQRASDATDWQHDGRDGEGEAF